jgi:hypothetical protein
LLERVFSTQFRPDIVDAEIRKVRKPRVLSRLGNPSLVDQE